MIFAGAWGSTHRVEAEFLAEKLEGADPVNRVGSVEVFDGGAVAESEFGVESSDLGELVIDPRSGADCVIEAPFDHKRTRGDEGCHFGVVEVAAEVPLPDLVFADVDVARNG